MKMTSIEWLIQEIQTKHDKSFIEFYGAEIEQAKEMHKQEIIDAFRKGFNRDYFSSNFQDQKEFAEQYYSETYNK